MPAFKIDESKLNKTDRVRLNIRRLVVERLEHLRENVANAGEQREVDSAALTHARTMLRNAEEAPVKRLKRRVRASLGWKTLSQSDLPEVSKAMRNKARQDILAELKLSTYEIEMADHYSLLPMGGP